MITLDKFYFNPGEIEICGGGGRNDWHLTFIPHDDDGLHIKISTLDRKTFEALLARIATIGQGMLKAHDSAQTRVAIGQPPSDPI